MQPLTEIEQDLADAAGKASKYEWMKAADTYQQILDKLDRTKDPGSAANVSELAATSYFKAAFQSIKRDEFQNTMRLSEKSHHQAADLYEATGADPIAKRARARALFGNFWILDDPNQKRIVLDKCIQLAQESAQFFELHREKEQHIETLLDLLTYREGAVNLSKERKQLVDLFESAVETAWRIIDDIGANQDQIVQSINLLLRLYLLADYVLERPRYEELERKLEKLRDNVAKLSENVRTTRAQALAIEALLVLAADLEGNVAKTLSLYENGLSKAKELGDHYLIGRLTTVAAAMKRWAALSEEYVEQRREQLEKTVVMSQYAIESLRPSSPVYWPKRAYGIQVDAYNYLALTVETDQDKKRNVLRKAIDTIRPAMRYESYSFVTGMGHQLSRAMYLLATMDVGNEERTRLLKEAQPIREEAVRTLEVLSPHSFSRGTMLNYLALIKSELSKVEEDPTRRLDLLKEASSDMDQCMKLCRRITGITAPLPGQVRAQALYSEWHGDILQQLCETTLDTTTGREAVEAYKQSISYLSNSNNLGPIPSIRWKIAQTHDMMKEYAESSESFRHAAQEYRLAAKKIEGLAGPFEDLAQYMETWAIIEEARLGHEREQYTASAEAYTKAATHLRTVRNWSYLSRHYSACSFLELGEAMSRQERQQSAIESFNAAKTNFHEAGVQMEQMVATSQPQEKRELDNWLEITQGRLKYTLARLQLEEAKILDARMEEEASSVKYGAASESFRKLIRETHHQPTRTELETLSLLCDAWAKMKGAEASASPERYADAATSFKLVESKTAGKKMKLAALANASMCKALESGCLFRRTRNRELYQTIKTNLETAADFYEEAGIRKAADWTRATQRFFDALTYLRDAEVETDPKKRTELFHLAENHLQLAATIYGEAGYAAKRQESLRHLERAREEKRLLLMPVEVLAESPTVADVTISPISLAEDRATGLAKFEDAHVVGRMTLSSTDVNAGEKLTIQLQVLNMGKTPATLRRIENLPAKGLELLDEKGEFSVEEHSIDLRGRRLEYLKSYQVNIQVRARRKGAYELRPRITFLDEKGKSGFNEFGTASLRVKEIGVLGWIRGPS